MRKIERPVCEIIRYSVLLLVGTVPFPVIRVVRIGACEWSEKACFGKKSKGKLKSLLTHTFHIGINSLYRGILGDRPLCDGP